MMIYISQFLASELQKMLPSPKQPGLHGEGQSLEKCLNMLTFQREMPKLLSIGPKKVQKFFGGEEYSECI